MRRRHVLAIGILGFILSLSFYAPLQALDMSFSQQIQGTHSCNRDEVYSGLHPDYVFVPEECSQHLPEASTLTPSSSLEQPTQKKSVPRSEASSVDSSTQRDGNQGIFENSVIEPLASWVGIGNPQASPANPVIATITLGTGTGIAVDAALFESQYTQRVLALIRRRMKGMIKALFR